MRTLYCYLAVTLILWLASPASFAQEPAPGDKAAWAAQVEQNAPKRPTAELSSEGPRKVLVFSLATGYQHSVIPYVDRVFEILGRVSGAFATTISRDIEDLAAENLKRYDVLVLNNTCSVGPRRNLFLDVLEQEARYQKLSVAERATKCDALEKSILDFVRGGNGLVVMHGAPTLLNNSPEFTAMVGGAFDYHPPSQEVTVRTADPAHPLVAAFRDNGPFVHRDEPYCFKGAYEKQDFRPLLMFETKGVTDPAGHFGDRVRYAAWIKPYGEGRVFFCSPGHYPESYTSPVLLQFVLDGTQYAAGDLKCDDSKS